MEQGKTKKKIIGINLLSFIHILLSSFSSGIFFNVSSFYYKLHGARTAGMELANWTGSASLYRNKCKISEKKMLIWKLFSAFGRYFLHINNQNYLSLYYLALLTKMFTNSLILLLHNFYLISLVLKAMIL